MEDQELTYDPHYSEEKIKDDIIAVCAANAVLRTDGVASLSGGIQNQISRTFRRKDILSKGVKIDQDKEGIFIDIFVNAQYGINIPVLAWDIQHNVKSNVEEIIGKSVATVNVHIQGIEEQSKER